MRLQIFVCFLLVPAGLTNVAAAQEQPATVPNPQKVKGSFPTTFLQVGDLKVLAYLPDANQGFYRGSRFDWSGMTAYASWQGHQYFTAWQSPTHPTVNHGAGPADEFDIYGSGTLPPGYDEAKSGELFLKIGVGWLRKGEEKNYSSFRPYPIEDAGKWLIKRRSYSITFKHLLPTYNGYGCEYQKQLILEPEKRALRIRHRLRNTGTKRLVTTTYCHNFMRFADSPIGPEYQVSLSVPSQSQIHSPLIQRIGRQVTFNRTLDGNVLATLAEKPALTEGLNWELAHSPSGSQVRFSTKTPLEKCDLYAEQQILCVEPYARFDIQAGKQVTWDWSYKFQPQL